MPRWTPHEEFMPAVTKLIIEMMTQENRAPYLREVMALDPRIGQRLASVLLHEGQVPPKAGRPWTDHSEYMPEVRRLADERARRGLGISATLIEQKIGVGRDVAAALLDELGLATTAGPSNDELKPVIKEIIARSGDRWSIIGIARDLGIHVRRARYLIDDLGLLPEKIEPGHNAAGTTWWTEGANKARWSKPRGG